MRPEQIVGACESSPALSELKQALTDELCFQVEHNVTLDPLTILTIISIVIQVIVHCRETHDDEQIVQDMRDIRTLPPRHLLRLRRRLTRLWRDCCADSTQRLDNPFLSAVYSVAEQADPAALQALVALAHE
jgi:hypothetical protein